MAKVDLADRDTQLQSHKTELETRSEELQVARADIVTRDGHLESSKKELEARSQELKTAKADIADRDAELETSQARAGSTRPRAPSCQGRDRGTAEEHCNASRRDRAAQTAAGRAPEGPHTAAERELSETKSNLDMVNEKVRRQEETARELVLQREAEATAAAAAVAARSEALNATEAQKEQLEAATPSLSLRRASAPGCGQGDRRSSRHRCGSNPYQSTSRLSKAVT